MFQFPASPIVNQLFTPVPGITFRWNGTAWFLIAGPGAFLTQADGDARYQQLSVMPGRNIITNGGFDVWQRNTTFSGLFTNAQYVADRWRINLLAGGTGTFAITQAASGPGITVSGFHQNVLRVAPTVADAAIAAGDGYGIEQVVEGYNWQLCAQRSCILSFWVRSSLIGTYCVALKNSGFDRTIIFEYTIAAANVWQYVTIPIPASPVAGTWFYDNRAGVRVLFTLAAGSTFQITPGTWQTGNFLGTANQVNFFSSTLNTLELTGVQLEPGSVATPFERLPISVEIDRCQRYFEKSYDMATFPGAVTTVGIYQQRYTLTGGPEVVTIQFRTRKRISATMAFYSPVTGAVGNWRDSSASVDRAAAISTVGESEISLTLAAATASNGLQGHWTADAEL